MLKNEKKNRAEGTTSIPAKQAVVSTAAATTITPVSSKSKLGLLKSAKKRVTDSKAESVRSKDLGEAKRLLANIKADDYKVWFQVGCALKGMGADYKMFRDWSANSEKFDEDECQAKWGQLPDELRAGLTTLRKFANGIEINPAEAETTKKKKAHIASAAAGIVPHTQEVDGEPSDVCAVTPAVSSDFTPPPEEMLPSPSSEEERVRQAAWLITRLFKPRESFEFCGTTNRNGRKIPDRGNDNISGLDAKDTVEALCNDSVLKEDIHEVTTGFYIGMNPVRQLEGSEKAPTDESLTDYRVALIECDDLPVDEQWAKLKALRLPVIAVTYSGSKSLHCLCRIDAGNDKKLYRERIAKLYEFVQSHGLPVDNACKNPSRLTRCPGFLREGKMQYLVSESWGYPSWDAFAANELQGQQGSAADQPGSSDAQAASSDALTAKYGAAVEFAKNGKPHKLNQSYFAAYTMQSYNLQYSQGEFWEYEKEKGLWVKMADAQFRSKTAEAIRSYGKRNNMDLSMLCSAQTCDCVKAFIFSSVADPFARRGKKFVHVANGVLEIEGQKEPVLKAFSPDYYSRNRCEIAYDPHALCPRFLHELLESVLPQDDIDLLQLYCGQCLLGDNFTQKFLLLTGIGGTGKGVIVNIIRNIVGVVNCSELRTKHTMGRFETANYLGKTLLLGADVSPTFLQEKGAAYIKALTGNDPLTAELKGKPGGISFQGNFNIIVTSNSRLQIKMSGDQSAWMRRIIYISFDRSGTETPIPNFADILLKEEGPGILRWMVQGLQKLLVSGYPKNSSSDRRVDNLLRESDSVMGFIRARVRHSKEPHSDITFDTLHKEYSYWCYRHEWSPLEKRIAKSQFVDGIMSALRISESHDVKQSNIPGVTRGWHGLIIHDRDIEDDDTDSTNTSAVNS